MNEEKRKSEKLLDIIGMIEDEIVLEADVERFQGERQIDKQIGRQIKDEVNMQIENDVGRHIENQIEIQMPDQNQSQGENQNKKSQAQKAIYLKKCALNLGALAACITIFYIAYLSQSKINNQSTAPENTILSNQIEESAADVSKEFLEDLVIAPHSEAANIAAEPLPQRDEYDRDSSSLTYGTGETGVAGAPIAQNAIDAPVAPIQINPSVSLDKTTDTGSAFPILGTNVPESAFGLESDSLTDPSSLRTALPTALPDAFQGPALSASEIAGTTASKTSTPVLDPTLATGYTLPKLSVDSSFGGGFGFEAFLAPNAAALSNGNPWDESFSMNTLPVFKNKYIREAFVNQEVLIPEAGLSNKKMMEVAKDAAQRSGLSIEELLFYPSANDNDRSAKSFQDVSPDSTSFRAVAPCEEGKVIVHYTGEVMIFFEPGVTLPEQYSFTYNQTSRAQAEETLGYLLKTYSTIVDMEAPALDLFGDYNIYGEQSFKFSVYESGGVQNPSQEDLILWYNFSRLSFHPDSEGKLSLISWTQYDLSEKIGDYPIISPAEAKELLLSKHYITTVPVEVTDDLPVAKVELLYRTVGYEQVFMPYYRFLIELPPDYNVTEEGLKAYGAYYVPAVQKEYLTDLPIWDGRFN